MVKIKLEEKEYLMPENYDEMTLDAFIRITKVQESGLQYEFQEMFLIKMLEALIGVEGGDLDELTLEDLANLAEKLKYLLTEPKPKKVDKIVIGDITYAFPDNYNKLTTGEIISIRTLNEGKSTGESILNLLSIILRPAILQVDSETGREYWKRVKFDAQNLEHRKRIFGNLPVLECLYSVNFFLTGRETLTELTQDFMIEEQK